jgi:hypothetical protein
MKLLNPRVHGYLDYMAVLLLALAPTLFGFSGTPAILAYVAAAAQLGMSLMTAYPLGVAKVLPFTVHGGIEVAVTILFLVSPWLLGFADQTAARNFFLASGVGLGLVYLVTNYKAADLGYGKGTGSRHAYT